MLQNYQVKFFRPKAEDPTHEFKTTLKYNTKIDNYIITNDNIDPYYFSFLLLTGLKIGYKINVGKSIVFLHTCIEQSESEIKKTIISKIVWI